MLEFADRDGDVADPWYTGNFDATWRDCSDGCHGLFRQIMMDPRFAGDLGDGGFSDSDDEGYYSDGLKYDDFPRG